MAKDICLYTFNTQPADLLFWVFVFLPLGLSPIPPLFFSLPLAAGSVCFGTLVGTAMAYFFRGGSVVCVSRAPGIGLN